MRVEYRIFDDHCGSCVMGAYRTRYLIDFKLEDNETVQLEGHVRRRFFGGLNANVACRRERGADEVVPTYLRLSTYLNLRKTVPLLCYCCVKCIALQFNWFSCVSCAHHIAANSSFNAKSSVILTDF